MRLWLAQWSAPARGIWFPSMTDGAWWKIKGGVKPHAGKFRPVESWLGSSGAKKVFNAGLAADVAWDLLRSCKANKYRLLAGNVALEIGGLWGYCERCRFTQRPFPGTNRCVTCGEQRVRVLDPDTDEVFQARKGYYRASAVRALRNPPEPPMSIIAAEHTAQLNAAQSDEVFSSAEEYELLFQDVDVALPAPGMTEHAGDRCAVVHDHHGGRHRHRHPVRCRAAQHAALARQLPAASWSSRSPRQRRRDGCRVRERRHPR